MYQELSMLNMTPSGTPGTSYERWPDGKATVSSLFLPPARSLPLFSTPARWMRRALDVWQAARERRRADRAFDQLDGATLKDIGVSRGESGSYWAEATGVVPATRRRLLHPHAGSRS
jgi:uncharacterized protein YjiS (DUF1127 family)